jgi:4-hydroxy 2-oxovalerate aldolase
VSEVELLDVTLREGSYVVDLGFTAADTQRIAGALEAAGVRYIEVGHAWGLNAATCGFGRAAETDDAYLAAAAAVLSDAKFGMFCLAGVTRAEDLRRAASYGMDFARVGTNATAIDEAAPLVEQARDCGLFVACNLMKSYTLEPHALAEKVDLVERFGAQAVYLVDSAGGMLPADVKRYCDEVAERSSIPFGFHGHENLGLAVANSLVAAQAGAQFVDGSLQGLGRSAGNAALELLVAVLHRQGIATGINLIALLDASEALAAPLVRRHGIDSLDVSVGFAQFHSSFLDLLLEVASEYAVDPRLLVYEVCKQDRVRAPRELIVAAAINLQDGVADETDVQLGLSAPPGSRLASSRPGMTTRW